MVFNKEYFSQFFYYDPTSPSGLRWKYQKANRVYPGCVAGSIKSTDNGSYKTWGVELNGRQFNVHRIIYELEVATVIGLVVDHLDGNAMNNNLDNLCLKTSAENSRNARKRKDNTSGVSNVAIKINRFGTTAYIADYRKDGKRYNKSFCTRKLGLIPAFYLAQQWRNERISELNAQGAGYTERHGT